MSYEELIQDISIRHTDLINKECIDLFRWLNLNHFWYCKIDNEGNYSFFGSHIEWCELFVREELYRKYPYIRHPRSIDSGIHLIKTPQDPALFDVLTSCKNRFDMQCLLSVVTKDEKGIEEFGFAAKSENDKQLSLLMNELPLLRLFVKNLLNERPILKEAMESNPINIGQLIGPSFYESGDRSISENKQLILQKMKLSSHLELTEGEIEVLKLMQEGLSAGQISACIYRSTRTVEHRIERLKNKLTCYSKAELIKKAREFELAGLL